MSSQQFQEAIDCIKSLGSNSDYFGVDASFWKVELCPSEDDIAEVVAQIEQLCDLISQYWQINGWVAATAQEDKGKRQRLDRIAKQVEELKDFIDLEFSEWLQELPLEYHVPQQIRLINEDWVPLLSARECAEMVVLNRASPEDFLWSLIAEDDLAGAYWTACSLAASGRPSPLPEWLLAAVQGSRWLSSSSNEMLVQDLMGLALKYEPGTDVEALFGLSASILPALIAPASGMLAWLRVPGQLNGLRQLAQVITFFASRNANLTSQNLAQATGKQQIEAMINSVVQEAREWRQRAPTRRPHSYARAGTVWRKLVSPGGIIYNLLEPVVNDKRHQAQQVRHDLSDLHETGVLAPLIARIDSESNPIAKTHPIQGLALTALVSSIQKGCEFADAWCALVERNQTPDDESGRIAKSIQHLRDDVRQTLPAVKQDLDGLDHEANPASVRAAARCLYRSVSWLCQKLALSDPFSSQDQMANTWEWLQRDRVTLYDALAQRLLILPDADLNDEGQPNPQSVSLIIQWLTEGYKEGYEASIPVSIESWCRRKDYRFVEYLLNILETEEHPEASRYREYYQESKERAARDLEDLLDNTEHEIELAVIDGIIGDSARAEYLATVVATKPDETVQYSRVEANIQVIRDFLSVVIQQRVEHLEALWHVNRHRLDLTIPAHKAFYDRVEEAFDARDIRLIDQLLAQLRNEGQIGENDLVALILNTQTPILDMFLDRYAAIERAITQHGGPKFAKEDLIKVIQSQGLFAGLDFGSVNRPRAQEAVDAVTLWGELRRSRPHEIAASLDIIKGILKFVGFTFHPQTTIREITRGSNWLNVKVTMSAPEGSVEHIAQLSSRAGKSYDVLCVWDRPTVSELVARLGDQNIVGPRAIVIYLGWLDRSQRGEWRRLSIQSHLHVLLLDEILLIHLTAVENRLTHFVRCTVPFTSINPYDSALRPGTIPEEMFFGRQTETSEIMSQDGTSIVYGGRQLGKSALLGHVIHQFTDPSRKQYACAIDIKQLGRAGGRPISAIWQELREALQKLGLLASNLSSDSMGVVTKHIREMMQDKNLRVLVMFDEADVFLDIDAVGYYRYLEEFRSLMNDTSRRFKVVFAGLHDVQRFNKDPNQPIAHFGVPVCVGPLDAKAATELISEPLRVLGYEADPDAVLRIISYTNSNPGLIQHFCKELVRILQTQLQPSLPYRVARHDVESVYRDEKLRKRIAERFEWTLALDDRYQAIALILAVEQMAVKDSFSNAYHANEVLRMIRSWWPESFTTYDVNGIKDILDEMHDLGVLVKTNTAEQTYRLRSPNLVRLMGTDQEIESKLLDLVTRARSEQTTVIDYHAIIDEHGHQYSPLTNGQDRMLGQRGIGIGLVFSSNAQGYKRLSQAFDYYVQDSIGHPRGAIIAPDNLPASGIYHWLEDVFEKSSGQNGFVALLPLSLMVAKEMAITVKPAQQFVNDHRSSGEMRNRGRVLFTFDALATWEWLSQPLELRESLENDVDTFLNPLHWNVTGIQRRLEQMNNIATAEVAHKVLQITGGWDFLLEELFDRVVQSGDTDTAVHTLEADLANPSHPCTREFLKATGLATVGHAEQTIRLLNTLGPTTMNAEWYAWIAQELNIAEAQLKSIVIFLQRMGCISEQTQQGDDEHIAVTIVSADPVLGALLDKMPIS